MSTSAEILEFDAKSPHELCGKRHSRYELSLKCEARDQARLLERTRRIENARLVPATEFIRRRRYEAATYDKITAELKREYPSPPSDLIRSQEGWWVGNVIELDSRRFINWPI